MSLIEKQASKVEAFSFFVEIPALSDSSFTLMEYAPYACSVDYLFLKTDAGDIDVSIQINGTDVTGMDTVSATSTQSTFTATAANIVTAGNRVTVLMENDNISERLAGTLQVTRI